MRRRSFLLASMLLPSFAVRGQLPPEYPAGYRKLISRAQREGRLVIYSTTDLSAASPLIADFQAMYPGIELEYTKMNSPDLYNRILSETVRDGRSADIAWSSSMDLQIKLANDGFADAYLSPESHSLPKWAVWRGEAYGTTFEPLVIAYNRKLVPVDEVPHTHGDLLRLLTAKRLRYRGNVTTYDIERSAVGFLAATQDSLAMSSFWSLVEALAECDVELEANTSTMLERIASGKVLLGYNLLGSYAIANAMRDPAIGIVLLRDYTLVLSRVILIAHLAPHPNAARLWIDFILSRRGQTIIAERSRLFAVHPDVTGDFTAAALSIKLGTSARPIPVGPGLLVYLDQAKRAAIMKRWRQGFLPRP
jgi:iron(III) transport system substrate-binding protein